MAKKRSDCLSPSAGLLCKLGSVAVHANEFLSPDGHEFDKAALLQLLRDHEVVAWLAEMDAMEFLPKMRRG